MKVESKPYHDARPSFAETLTLPPLPGSVAYNWQNPTLDEAFEQNPKAMREIARSSQDMPVLPPFTPPGQKAAKGARTKTSSTVTSQEESPMETDAPKQLKYW